MKVLIEKAIRARVWAQAWQLWVAGWELSSTPMCWLAFGPASLLASCWNQSCSETWPIWLNSWHSLPVFLPLPLVLPLLSFCSWNYEGASLQLWVSSTVYFCCHDPSSYCILPGSEFLSRSSLNTAYGIVGPARSSGLEPSSSTLVSSPPPFPRSMTLWSFFIF